MENMNYCPQCGTKIIKKAKFCHNCGHALVGEVPQLKQKPDKGMSHQPEQQTPQIKQRASLTELFAENSQIPVTNERSSGKVVGIDLGTTFSRVAVFHDGKSIIIPNAEGELSTPSIVALDQKTGGILIGALAKRQAVKNPENTIYSIKRFMGCKWDKQAGGEHTVKEDMRSKPYKVTKSSNNDVQVLLGSKNYTPVVISAIIIKRLKLDSEAYLGGKVNEAVISVPSYFDYWQRLATKDAGEIAGLKVLRIINEPTAAALAYGLDKKKEETIAVYHLGGGTFDISILELGEGTFQVKSTSGDTHLGGDDFDEAIMDWLCIEFKKDQGIDLKQDGVALQSLKEAAEKAKCELSTAMQTEIILSSVAADTTARYWNITLTRAKLEQLVMDLVEKTAGLCKQALSVAGLSAKQINEVILVGGQTRMPLVQQKVKEIFDKESNKSVIPDEVVAMGAAIQGGVLKGEVNDVLLLDVTPLTLGIETLGGVMTPLIPRNTPIPMATSQVFSTVSDGQTSVAIYVLEGERAMANDNNTVGCFMFDGIVPAPRFMPQIEVSINIDMNGIVSVKAHDKGTGKEQKRTITDDSLRNRLGESSLSKPTWLSQGKPDLPGYNF